MEKRNGDQLGGFRLDLSKARMGKAESRYRAGFWPLSGRSLNLEPSLLPPLRFDALDDELASIAPGPAACVNAIIRTADLTTVQY